MVKPNIIPFLISMVKIYIHRQIYHIYTLKCAKLNSEQLLQSKFCPRIDEKKVIRKKLNFRYISRLLSQFVKQLSYLTKKSVR